MGDIIQRALYYMLTRAKNINLLLHYRCVTDPPPKLGSS